ncbi:uncharacterized protein [Lepeophtheirus salmonis]|uniref:uncharacterized protein isoform X1 n=2 Tax=Lepeophtheirus salmonis TaxID=72036 RepID=UPI001AE685BB|nr:probable serine/threonine-protein kinase fhkD isoform X1 [Lepeophtheirus salmonis]
MKGKSSLSPTNQPVSKSTAKKILNESTKHPQSFNTNKVKSKISSDDINTSFESKFEQLWDIKVIENGMVKVPLKVLQDLIHKEDITKIYDIDERPVARGLFTTVRKCTHRETGITYAAKFSSRFRTGVDYSMEVLHEIAMLSLCNQSSNIVHLKDVFQNRNEIILVLEYAPGGDFQHVLDDDMVPFEEDVISYMIQVLQALEFLHDKNVAHLDIKPQNIVLMGQFPNCEIKLCDLEVARVIWKDEEVCEVIGTPDYVAPEIISMEPITLASDIWSVGVLAYVLLTGFSPFGGESDQDTLRNITMGILDFPRELFEGVSEEAKDFIRTCLIRDMKKRPTVRQCLASPWLVQNSEPPSPSPLMLKIPTPDPPMQTVFTNDSSIGNNIGFRISCQTCRDRTTERRRYLSKSREAIFEKVAANSNLRKSLSKSKERLCDVRLSFSKSRDLINYPKKNMPKGSTKNREFIGSKRVINGETNTFTQELIHINKSSDVDFNLTSRENSIHSSEINEDCINSFSSLNSKKGHVSSISSCENSIQNLIVPETLLEVSEDEEDKSLKTINNQTIYEKENDRGIQPWRDELVKYTSQKHTRVADLIGTFDTTSKGHKPTYRVRRGSLQMNIDSSLSIIDETQFSEGKNNHKHTFSKDLKLQRRKSASAIPPLRESINKEKEYEKLKIIKDTHLNTPNYDLKPYIKVGSKKKSNKKDEAKCKYMNEENVEKSKNNNIKCLSATNIQIDDRGLKGKYNFKTWDYFEIDHPKAITDKKLQQLKAKYARNTNIKNNECPHSFRILSSHDISDNTFFEVHVNPLTSVITTNTIFKDEIDLKCRRYSTPLLHQESGFDNYGYSRYRHRSNSIQSEISTVNPINRMCNGAFSRAFERYSLATTNLEEDSSRTYMSRRRSNPILKTTFT